ncbi:uncharacterized protein C6orf118-like isoform X2 [Tachysurus vachellii]|uniref:uncharacterized protein C6orf118-like isoform X2 n=1 Tax=Tachysurus vachellii TaxID=175792 RepID=UPI00296AC17A|nr:uncharacterized protein C6orf118-like isoform X2 [Tachysurus vachellii]
MSVSGSQTLRRSDMQRQLKEVLHSVEKAHKADIQTYCSGHLGPNKLVHRSLNCRPRKAILSKPKCKDVGLSRVRERSQMEANVEETSDALHSLTIGTMLHIPRIQERPECPSEESLTGVQDMTELAKLRKAIQENSCTVSDMMEQDSLRFTHSHKAGLARRDQQHRRLHTDMRVLRIKAVTTRKCLSGIEAAKRHERRLQQVLRKLPASGGPCRKRLAVFSDVFNDVCDGSPAFGSLLREIKTEYDLYLKSLLFSQSLLWDKSASTSFGVSTEATELKKVASQVLSLEQEARRALEENDRVQIECEDALVDQKGNESYEPVGQCDEVVFSGVNPCALSSVSQVEAKRQQVWKVWAEVQMLQKDIRETMVSTVTTSALENCIRDSEDEILNLAASNVLLQRTIKDLEQNISAILRKAKVSEETTVQVWEEIWTTLNGHD